MPVSLIATVRDEAGSIDALLDSILAGTRAPDEIVIADGGSADGTYARLQARATADSRIRAVSAPGNRSVGRNAAIRAARHDLIVCTDAGVEVDPSWLVRIARPLEEDPSIDVVAGFYEPMAKTAFERAAGVISAPHRAEVDPDRFLPSTRSVAFRRAAWARAGGFDESLAHNEDTPFALALRGSGARFTFEPDAIVRWRPRGTLGGFFRQHRRFGRGDGESRVQGWFYATISAKYAIGLLLILAGVRYPPAWGILAGAAGLFAASQVRRSRGRLAFLEAVTLLPFLKVIYDVAYLAGYAAGRIGPRPPAGPPRAPESPRASG